MRSKEYDDDEYSKNDKPDSYNRESFKDEQKIKLFRLATKYALLAFAIFVSFSVIMSSNNLFVATLFIVIIWAVGNFFYKKRKSFYQKYEPSTESEPSVEPNPVEGFKKRLSTLDEEFSRPLNSYEKNNWDNITNTLLNENFDSLKPFNKKKKKDK